MVVAQIQRGFTEEIAVFVETAQQLGRLRFEGNREAFVQILEAAGMEPLEAASYFDLVFKRSEMNTVDWKDPLVVKSNTAMSDAFGISLHNGDGQPPRNWLLYRLFQLQFPAMFQAHYSGVKHLQGGETKQNVPIGSRVNPVHRVVHFDKQPVDDKGECTNPLAIYRVIQGHEPARFRADVIRSAGSLRAVFGKEFGIAMADLFYDLQMVIPSESMIRLLAEVLERGKRGKEIVFAGAFCPDYAYEVTGNPHLPYRYTFDGVGEGVGLVAQQFARIVPRLSSFFSELGISHRFVIGIADFEADADAVLQRVGLSREEFVRRCQGSLDAFRECISSDIPLELELFGEARGSQRFRRYASCATECMMNGNFGNMANLHPDLDEIIARIPGQYRTFYERWYGRDMSDAEISGIILSQGGEYAAVARIYQEDLGPNVIFLAGDRPEMNRFNAFHSCCPTLCAKRAY